MEEAAMTTDHLSVGEIPDYLKNWKLVQDEVRKKKERRAKAAQEFADQHKQYEDQLEKKDQTDQVSTQLVEDQDDVALNYLEGLWGQGISVWR